MGTRFNLLMKPCRTFFFSIKYLLKTKFFSVVKTAAFSTKTRRESYKELKFP